MKQISPSEQTADATGIKSTLDGGRTLKIGLIGFGTVGRSVAKILTQDINGPLVLSHICNRNIANKRVDGLPPQLRWTENVEEVLSSDVDVVVELIGGIEPAGEWIGGHSDQESPSSRRTNF